MAFHLAVLVTEVVATLGLVVLEAFGRFTETLRSPTVGFQLGHDLTNSYGYRSQAAPCNRSRANSITGRFQAVALLLLFRCEHHDHLFAFHERVLLHHAVRGEISGNPIQKSTADVLVHHLAAAEP